MKKILSGILAAASLLLVLCAMGTGVYADADKTMKCIRAAGPVTLDGIPAYEEGWDQAEEVELRNADGSVSCKVRLMWDNARIYFFASVKDPNWIGDARSFSNSSTFGLVIAIDEANCACTKEGWPVGATWVNHFFFGYEEDPDIYELCGLKEPGYVFKGDWRGDSEYYEKLNRSSSRPCGCRIDPEDETIHYIEGYTFWGDPDNYDPRTNESIGLDLMYCPATASDQEASQYYYWNSDPETDIRSDRTVFKLYDSSASWGTLVLDSNQTVPTVPETEPASDTATAPASQNRGGCSKNASFAGALGVLALFGCTVFVLKKFIY